MTKRRPDWLGIHSAIAAVFCVAAALFVSGAREGWGGSLASLHAFRQSQTAVSAYYLQRGSGFLSYETPVVGAPWAIPYELPLYQWTVAKLSSVSRLTLVSAGRIVSLAAFFLVLLFLWLSLGLLQVPWSLRLVPLAMLLLSPLYIFWSRAFMIESTALCLGAAYSYFALQFSITRKGFFLGPAALAGIGLGMVKATTFPGFFILSVGLYMWKTPGTERGRLRSHILPALGLGLLPLVAMILWVQHTDAIKELNVIGQHLTSRAGRAWNYGTWQDRSSAYWITLYHRIAPELIGSFFVLLLPLIGYFFEKKLRSSLMGAALLTVAFLVPAMIFTNLHVVHDYYSYANGIFLILALGWILLRWIQLSTGTRRAVPIVLWLIALGSAQRTYSRPDGYLTAQLVDHIHLPALGRFLRDVTAPEEVILVFGLDWSSLVPFYAERRALMWPAWLPQEYNSEIMQKALEGLRAYNVGAIAYCFQANELQDLQTHLRARYAYLSAGGMFGDICKVAIQSNR